MQKMCVFIPLLELKRSEIYYHLALSELRPNLDQTASYPQANEIMEVRAGIDLGLQKPYAHHLQKRWTPFGYPLRLASFLGPFVEVKSGPPVAG